MTASEFAILAGRLMRQPAAPFHEHTVRHEVESICADHRLNFERDEFGNIIVSLRTDPKTRPLVLAAHLDHPGFEIVRSLSAKSWLARFLGGVPDSYFRRGVPVRLMPGAIAAKLGARPAKAKEFELHASLSVEAVPAFAVWELEDFAVRKGLIHGRACDDLVGVASILATLIDLKRRRARVNVIGVIARAEEIGFLGAMAVAAGKRLRKNSMVISLETSRELPGVKMGQGVILRVGDRTSIFDSEAMRFLGEAAADLKSRNKKFQFQRALMSGGTCEATAYQEFGFQTAAVCVALGNYHNCAEKNRIAAEFVSVADALSMVELLAAAAGQMPQYAKLIGKLPRRLQTMLG
ncbi:MAG TPA: M20/M25/M40 family metallo-hydrolase, partial [Verrucomicrobiae bacterium]|nr:M20/M25/M40 family metallo-hydrolase [Verrucomicrobiae bacterium]